MFPRNYLLQLQTAISNARTWGEIDAAWYRLASASLFLGKVPSGISDMSTDREIAAYRSGAAATLIGNGC